ncbi:MAG: hypothetical protein JSV24_05450 [Bacteroidales bacterium]|nr:MAG: hypothetical protein JSV24_05450 [Bacteroidales bacterium]
MENRSRNTGRAFLGIILVLVGLLLVARNFDFFPFPIHQVIFSWQMLLIFIGVLMLVARSNNTAGIILVLIGGFFLIPRIFDLPFRWEWHNFFWPILFIVFGVLVLLRGGRHRPNRFNEGGEQVLDDDYLDEVSIFGGGNRVITSQNFQGGKITSIFGGSTIDFRKSNLSKGKSIIDVFTMFGGSKLIVPNDWDIRVEIVSVFGGYSDKRNPDPHIVYDASKQLIIKGVAIFGGGEIKSY